MRLKEKVLNELLDFCKYGYCLEEETAKTYMQFLDRTSRSKPLEL